MSDTPEQALAPPAPILTAPPEADELVGKRVGDYLVEKAIGWGGMGIVYRAVHPLIGRKVAIKVLRPNFAADPEQVARFLNEARAISAIKHRGIIDIINFGDLPDGRQYMVMEYLDGETLEDLLRREGGLSPARALGIIDEVLDALSAAHKVGVVHRDLKPSNVYLSLQSNGQRYVKLVDFGLARRTTVENLERLSGKASLMAGTPEYLSPEQVNGVAATPRTDIYCAGVVLFEMVTGRLPFQAESVLELLNAHRVELPPRASTLVGGLPHLLDELIDQCLQKQPEQRPATVDAVRLSVARILRQLKDDATRVVAVPSRPLVTPFGGAEKAALEPVMARGIPKWVFAGAVGVVVLAVTVTAVAKLKGTPQPIVPVGQKLEPLPVPAPKEEAIAARPVPVERAEPLPVAEAPRKEPAKKEPARREPSRKGPAHKEPARVATARPAVTAAPAGPPKACSREETKWKLDLSIAFDEAEQDYTRRTAGKTDPVADKELLSARAKIKGVQALADCIQVVRGLEAWQRRHGR